MTPPDFGKLTGVQCPVASPPGTITIPLPCGSLDGKGNFIEDPLCINWTTLSFDAGYAAKHPHAGAEPDSLCFAGVYQQLEGGKLTFYREVREKAPNGNLTVKSSWSHPMGVVSKVLQMADFSSALPWTPNSGLSKAGLHTPHSIRTIKMDHAGQVC